MTKHYPGPWEAHKMNDPINPAYAILGGIGGAVTLATIPRWAESYAEHSEANARLIAAAPELLAALKEIADRGPIDGYGSASALMLRLVGTQSIARAVIAKAEGTEL